MKTKAKKEIRKKSKWCFACAKAGERTLAVKYANGSHDTYCRGHKNAYMKRWMKRRRKDDPTYGEPKPKGAKRANHRTTG